MPPRDGFAFLYPYASGCSSPERYEKRYGRTYLANFAERLAFEPRGTGLPRARRMGVRRIHACASFGPHGLHEETGESQKFSSVLRKHGDYKCAGMAPTQIPRPHLPAPRSGEPYLRKSVAFGTNVTTLCNLAAATPRGRARRNPTPPRRRSLPRSLQPTLAGGLLTTARALACRSQDGTDP